MNKRMLLVMGLLLALVGSGSAVVASGTELVILHTNDIHGRIEVDEGRLGMAYISSLIAYHRDQYEHVLVLDAGDTIHGRPITDRLEGESTVVAMNKAGYDVMVPGNHDFNFGYEKLLELEEMMTFDLVATNVFKDGELLFNPYVVKEVGAYTVGIFGLATSATYTTTHPRNIVGIEFGNMEEASRKYVEILRTEYNVDLVIALGHVGIKDSSEVVTQVAGIDLFVDGHSHSRLPEGEWVSDTLIVQAHEYGNYLGKVSIDLSGEEPIFEASLISAEAARDLVDPDEEMNELMQEFRDEVVRRLLGN